MQKQEASADILTAMNALKEGGVTQKWGAALQEPFQRRNVFMGELKRVGVLNPQAIGIASISEALSHAMPWNACVASMLWACLRVALAHLS